MYESIPILGLLGGIGSGKSFVADLFGELGCLVIHSDKLVQEAYNDSEVRGKLFEEFGERAFDPNGNVSRKALAEIIFEKPEDRRRLEGLVHPFVNLKREEIMAQAVREKSGKRPVAFVWDTPLLAETGLYKACDARVFVEAGREVRLGRVKQSRGWDEAELARRENLQWPLDKKRKISEYVVENTADAVYARGQVQDVISRIRG